LIEEEAIFDVGFFCIRVLSESTFFNCTSSVSLFAECKTRCFYTKLLLHQVLAEISYGEKEDVNIAVAAAKVIFLLFIRLTFLLSQFIHKFTF